MKLWILIAVLMPVAALAAPNIISDPAERADITHCGIYRGTEARVLSPVARGADGRPYCQHDIASWAPGTYSVTATFVITGTPEQESPRSDPLVVTIAQPALQAPGGLRVTTGALGTAVTTPTGTADLSSEGSVDWVHWGKDSAGSVNRKAGALTQIGALTGVGGTPARYDGSADRTGYTWSGGTPTASATTHAGLYIGGKGKGFELTAPADTIERTLVLYLGGFRSSATLSATLSDSSAPEVVHEVKDLANPFDRRVAITYRAGSAGQTLRVRSIQSAGNSESNVSFQAATLTGVAP